MLKKDAYQVVGKPSKPSKITPHLAMGFNARFCKLGSRLKKVQGSTCHSCYALKGRFKIPNVAEANDKRFDIQMKAVDDLNFREKYLKAWVVILKNEKYFRIFDTGDLQSIEHLELFVELAQQNAHVKFWMATREYKIVNSYQGNVPDNLVIRLSALMVNKRPPKTNYPTSTVHTGETVYGFKCTAPENQNMCGDCTACWNNEVKNVSYKIH